jgi:thioesterase domain-containing protein
MRVLGTSGTLYEEPAGFRRPLIADELEHPRVTPIQSRGSDPRIYLIHDLLGDVDCYRALASALGPDQPVYALRSFSSDLQGFHSIEKMATSYLTDLRAFDPTGPYILGGFSFGGAVAFEMARQLEEMGEEPILVVMIDAWIAAAGCKLRSREQFSILWKKTKEQGISYLTSKVLLKCIYWAHRARHLFLNLAGRICHGLRLEPPARVRLALLEKANRRILWAYLPRVYRGRVLLAACSRTLDFLSKRGSRFFGWEVLAGEQLEIHAVDAEHMSIMTEPSICEVAQRIKEKLAALDCIEAVRAN